MLRAAYERGLRVPDDLSVVGFDDIKYATIVSPALTTVRQPLAEMGRNGVSLLLRLMENPRHVTAASSCRPASSSASRPRRLALTRRPAMRRTAGTQGVRGPAATPLWSLYFRCFFLCAFPCFLSKRSL